MLYYGVVFVIIQITRMMGFHGAPDERKLALNSSFILKDNFCHSPPPGAGDLIALSSAPLSFEGTDSFKSSLAVRTAGDGLPGTMHP